MNLFVLFLSFVVLSQSLCVEKEVKVSSASAFQAALSSARAGDVIKVAAGSYREKFVIKNKKGRTSCPIKIRGDGDGSVIEGEKLEFCLRVENCQHVEISRLSFRSCDTGIIITKSSSIMADTLWIQFVHKMGIMIRDNSDSCQVSRCRISNTGETYSQWGFGVQIGRPKFDHNDGDNNAFEEHTKELDRCKNNKVIGNKIGPRVKAHGVVVYEGSESNKVFANQMDFISSWILLRGNGNICKKNICRVRYKEDTADCIRIEYTDSGQGTGNKVEDNDLYCEKASDYAITVDQRIPKGSNKVCKNKVSGALQGVANGC